MKRMLFFVVPVIAISICSCKKSPAATIAGTYEGHYNRDTIVVGSASVNVVESNELTANFVVDLENDPDFHLNGVEVHSDTSFYEFVYDGLEGEMTGTLVSNHMQWILMTPTDTIAFDGGKVN